MRLHLILNTGGLEITAALPSHAGRYTCSARNPAGVAHKHMTVTVQGRQAQSIWPDCLEHIVGTPRAHGEFHSPCLLPIIQEPPEMRSMAEEIQVVLHHGAVLPCEVQGFPRPSVTWQREGVPIATGDDTV